jgi:hypothetical protein
VPPPLVLRVMVRSIEADEHGGKLVVCKNKLASVSWPSMSTRIGWNEMSRVIAVAFQVRAKGRLLISQTPRDKTQPMPVGAQGLSLRLGLAIS